MYAITNIKAMINAAAKTPPAIVGAWFLDVFLSWLAFALGSSKT